MTTSLRQQRWRVLALTIGIAAAALLALSGSDASGTGATASAAKTVQIKGLAFKPGTLSVSRGARVAFVNSSSEPHTATRGGSFDTKRIAPGRSAVVRFNQRGTFAYHCKIHPFMKGKIVVD